MVNEQDIERLKLSCSTDPEASRILTDIIIELKDLRKKYLYNPLTKVRNRTAFEEVETYKAVV